jgi:hypothetical protein
VFDQHGGQVGLGHALAMVAPTGGGILYTLDGTDPLSPAGKIASTARGYTGPVSLTDPITRVRARAFDGAEWSALTEATFAVMLDLHIGELMADNEATVADESGQYEDWLELYNGSTLPADVGGMYLSDDPRNTTKWRIPDGTVVPAGGHVLVWADEDGSDGPLHANFKLSKQGEFLGLYAPDDLGNVPLDEIAFGAQGEDVATGDMPDGGSRLVTLLDPTPGASNLPPAGSTARFTALDPSANALVLEPQTVPMIGQVYRIALTGAPANARGFVFVGSAPSVVDLGPIGVGLVRPAMPKLWKLFDTDAFGGASVSWSLPPSPALVGARVYLQAYVGGAGLPNALVMTIGS